MVIEIRLSHYKCWLLAQDYEAGRVTLALVRFDWINEFDWISSRTPGIRSAAVSKDSVLRPQASDPTWPKWMGSGELSVWRLHLGFRE